MHVSFVSKKMLILRIKNKILNLLFYFIDIKKRIKCFKKSRTTKIKINYDDIKTDLKNRSFENLWDLEITSTDRKSVV